MPLVDRQSSRTALLTSLNLIFCGSFPYAMVEFGMCISRQGIVQEGCWHPRAHAGGFQGSTVLCASCLVLLCAQIAAHTNQRHTCINQGEVQV